MDKRHLNGNVVEAWRQRALAKARRMIQTDYNDRTIRLLENLDVTDRDAVATCRTRLKWTMQAVKGV
jgi:hypothetical protein